MHGKRSRPVRQRTTRRRRGPGPVAPDTAEEIVAADSRLTVVQIASGDLWAGAEVQLYHLAARLHQRSDIDLHVVLLNPGVLADRLRDIDVSVTVFNERELGFLALWRRVRRLLRTLRPQIVHTHRQKENVLGTFAALGLANTHLVRTVHGAREFRPRPWQLHKYLYTAVEDWCSRHRFAAIVAVSAPLAGELAAIYPAERIRLIENGIDVDAVRQSAREPAALPGAGNRLRIGIAGRLVPVKRLDVFLRTARLLLDQDPNCCAFYIFGDGPLEGSLRELAAQLGVSADVHFVGFVPNVAPCLAGLDALLITSDHEGLPMVLLEAMALAVPVVAHAVGAIPLVLDGGKLGTLVHENEPSHYARAIAELRRHPMRFRASAGAAVAAVTGHYSSQSCAQRYHSLYLQLTRTLR